MKRSLFFLVFAAMMLTACDVYYVENETPSRLRDRIVGSHFTEEYSETYHEYYEYDVWISRGSRANEVYI